jgi:hypothetical protein
MFQVLRKYCSSPCADPPITYIISAEYALIPADKPISYYDRKMTNTRAIELQLRVQESFKNIINSSAHQLEDVMICLSGNYRSVIGISSPSEQDVDICIPYANSDIVLRAKQAQGSIGKQAAHLYDWLYQAPPPVSVPSDGRKITFHGVEIQLDAHEIVELAKRKISEDPIGASRFESWYVRLGEQSIAPKWLLSVLTNVPVSKFGSAQIRVL